MPNATAYGHAQAKFIIYIMYSCESDKKFTFWHLSNKHNIYSLYYRKFCLNAHEAKRVYIQAKLMFIQTVMKEKL